MSTILFLAADNPLQEVIGFFQRGGLFMYPLLACSIVAVLIPAPDPARKDIPMWSIAAIILLPATLIAGCEAGTTVIPS